MPFLGCPVEHGETFVVGAIEQSLHLGGQAPNGTDMATLCCEVQSVSPILHYTYIKEMHTHTHLIAWLILVVDMQKSCTYMKDDSEDSRLPYPKGTY